MAKYKKLTDQQWSEIRKKWVLDNGSIRGLAKEYGVTHSTIQSRVEKENWAQDIKCIDNIKNNTSQLMNNLTPKYANPILRHVLDEVEHITKLQFKIAEIDEKTLSLINNVLAVTSQKVTTGDLGVKESAQILSLLEMTPEKISTRNGLSKAKQNIENAIQINNNTSAPTINVIGKKKD